MPLLNEIDAYWVIIKNGTIDNHGNRKDYKKIGVHVSLLSKNLDKTGVLIDDSLC